MHDSKQHGLNDCMDFIQQKKPALVMCLDASSNDYKYHQILKENNIDVLVLDHHLAD